MRNEQAPTSRRFAFSPHPWSAGAYARVLLAEDDGHLRELIATALREDGYDVVDVTDGGRLLVQLAEALRSDEERAAYDMLITDMRMPVSNGLQILESIRSIGWRVPVILMSAFADEALCRRTEALGALMFAKPFDVDDLRTAVLCMLRPGEESDAAAPSLVRISSFATWSAAREAQAALRGERIETIVAGPGIGPVALYAVPRDEERVRRSLFGEG